MLISVTEVCYLGDYRISLCFNTGECGEVDLHDFIRRTPQAAALLDVEEFKKVGLDEWPTVVWPGGFDLAPEFLYALVTGKLPPWESGAAPTQQAMA